MANRSSKAMLPDQIRRVLAGMRWRIRAYVWLEGLSLAVIWVVATFWAALAIDYLPVLAGASEMPRQARAVLLGLIAVVLVYILFQWVLRRTITRLGDRSMAVLLERRFGQFHDSLITSVELARRGGSEAQQRMLADTETLALGNLRGVRLGSVFNFRPLLRAVVGALALVATIGFLLVVNGHALELGVRRIYLLGDEPWPRNARIEVVGVETLRPQVGGDNLVASTAAFADRRVKVARGATVSLLVRADARARAVPEVCTVAYRTAEGDRGRVNMTSVGSIRDGYQLYRYDGKPFSGILSDVRFDVVGFDHRVRDYVVQAVDSPAIVAAELDCMFPDYMVDEQLSLWLPRTVPLTTGMQLPQGTSLTVRAQANKPLKAAYLFDPDSGETVTLEPSGDAQHFQFRIDSLEDHLSSEITLLDTDDVLSERPHRVYIAGIEDVAPVLDIGLQGVGSAITPDVVIPIQGKITDDYRVERRWIEVFSDDQAPRQMSFDAGAAGRVATSLDFRHQRSIEGGLALEPGQKLNLVVKAQDRRDLGSGPNTGVSDHFQLDVVTADQLLAMLEAREMGLRRRFEQIIEEMTEARDGLVRVKSEGPQAALERVDPEQEAEGPPTNPADLARRAWSLRLLRAQRAVLQSQKSSQETLGVAASFLDIRQELVNNRIDSEDRKQRLKEQIADPLQQIGEQRFAELDRLLGQLVRGTETSVKRAPEALEENAEVVAAANASIQQTNQILVEMDQVLQNMIELESFNDLLDIVRSLIDDQERLIGETKTQQKQEVLDLFQ